MTIEARIATLAIRATRLRQARTRAIHEARLGGPDETRLYERANRIMAIVRRHDEAIRDLIGRVFRAPANGAA